MIFNKENKGAEEIYNAIGLVDADVNYHKWEQYLSLQTRRVKNMISPEVYNYAEAYYLSSYIPEGIADDDVLVRKVQRAIAFFAFVEIIPSLDATHGNTSRKKMIAETEQPLSIAEAYKDEANILNIAYESVDDLLAWLYDKKPTYWIGSALYKSLEGLLVANLQMFDAYFFIGSYRLFFTLIPFNREVQQRDIYPLLSQKWYDTLIAAIAKPPTDYTNDDKQLIALLPTIQRAIVLLTMVKGLSRLPVEVIPKGVVQTRIIGTAKEKMVADDKVRREVIADLNNDVKGDLDNIANIIAILNGATADEMHVEPPHYVPGVKGFLWN